MNDPELVGINLPADTITLTANEATFILTAEPEAPGQLLMWLILGTEQMGYYRILILRDQLTHMIDQLLYFRSLTRDDGDKILRSLAGGDQ